MSIALVVTRGYGNGAVSGTIKDVVTRGYTIGEVPVPTEPTSRQKIFFPAQSRTMFLPSSPRSAKL